MKATTILLLSSIILLSCTKRKSIDSHSSIPQIAFASHGGLARFPYQAVLLASSLTYKYYGGKYAEHKGYFVGEIKQELWDSLILNLEKINYKNLDTAYFGSVDGRSIELWIYSADSIKIVKGQTSDLPNELRQFCDKLEATFKEANPKRVPYKISFDTQFQYDTIPPKYKGHLQFPAPGEKK